MVDCDGGGTVSHRESFSFFAALDDLDLILNSHHNGLVITTAHALGHATGGEDRNLFGQGFVREPDSVIHADRDEFRA